MQKEKRGRVRTFTAATASNALLRRGGEREEGGRGKPFLPILYHARAKFFFRSSSSPGGEKRKGGIGGQSFLVAAKFSPRKEKNRFLFSSASGRSTHYVMLAQPDAVGKKEGGKKEKISADRSNPRRGNGRHEGSYTSTIEGKGGEEGGKKNIRQKLASLLPTQANFLLTEISTLPCRARKRKEKKRKRKKTDGQPRTYSDTSYNSVPETVVDNYLNSN